MKCSECKHWSGNKYTDYGDCYRVIFELEPKLRNCKSTIDGLKGVPMWTPFDPHDLQYFNKNNEVKKLLRQLKTRLPEQVRVKTINKLDYFQTNKDMECKCNIIQP